DRLLDRGCLGISLPAGALAGIDALTRMRPLLNRLQDADAPLFVHPGPGPHAGLAAQAVGEPSLADPLWWSALTRYVAEMHAAWLTFVSAGRAEHRELRVIFSMLAGLAPLHAERLSSRGGPAPLRDDPLTFYETSSYGPDSTRRIADVVGAEQLLYGSDRPVVDPSEHGAPSERDWAVIAETTRRVFGERLAGPAVVGVGAQTRAAGRSDDVSVEPQIVRIAAAPRSGALVR
ncbi:MAG TPA: hypothetical protein VK761_01180, partial [Solirubrobacteraceae bacterium]|nr:hypothetical protein [Solirubrobacteraceae bacterium]